MARTRTTRRPRASSNSSSNKRCKNEGTNENLGAHAKDGKDGNELSKDNSCETNQNRGVESMGKDDGKSKDDESLVSELERNKDRGVGNKGKDDKSSAKEGGWA